MDEKVKKFLDRKHKAEELNAQKEKERILKECKLFDIVKSQEKTDKTPYWNADMKSYFGYVFCDVTDEEYDEILKYAKKDSEKDQNNDKNNNVIEEVLKRFGVCGIIVSVVAFLVITSAYENFSVGLLILFGGLIESLILLVFSKISKTLTKILNKVQKL